MSKTQRILSIDTNAKTVKGQKKGYLTGIIYLAPYTLSGVNLCPTAKLAGCHEACLYTAGRGIFSSVQKARLNKTVKFNNDLQGFMSQLIIDIKALQKKATKLGFIPLVRLNGTSDIRYENIYFDHNDQSVTIFEVFPAIQFYDYTKIVNRKNIPSNYDLTFSYSNKLEYRDYAMKAFRQGLRVAVVFRDKKSIPSTFMGKKCIDGDNTDIRHLDPQNLVVALYAKGKARSDVSGFVVDAVTFNLKVA